MIAYAKAYPHAVANGRPCPFPSHFLVTLDEVRTLLRHRGWNPRRATSPPREATREELKDSRVRTYQLITGTDATPRDFLGIGCRFMLGRTYCFGEEIDEIPEQEKEESTIIAPWQKPHVTTAPTKQAKPTHRVTCEVLNRGGNLSILTLCEETFTCKEDAERYAAKQSAISTAACSFGWVDTATLLDGDEEEIKTGTTDNLFWCDGTVAARVLTRPV